MVSHNQHHGMTDVERFMQFVLPEPNSGCWIWIGSIHKLGYGHFRLNGKTKRAHRISYILFKGNIPKEKELDHLCRLRCCVNPDHLEAVTSKENNKRGLSGHINKSKTHCPHGHQYSAENTAIRHGSRLCRECERIRAKKNYYKRKEKYKCWD